MEHTVTRTVSIETTVEKKKRKRKKEKKAWVYRSACNGMCEIQQRSVSSYTQNATRTDACVHVRHDKRTNKQNKKAPSHPHPSTPNPERSNNKNTKQNKTTKLLLFLNEGEQEEEKKQKQNRRTEPDNTKRQHYVT